MAATKDMEKRIHKAMSDAHDKLHDPMIKEIAILKKRIEKLEKAGAKKIAKSSKKITRAAKKLKP
jgi:hypothetical protein